MFLHAALHAALAVLLLPPCWSLCLAMDGVKAAADEAASNNNDAVDPDPPPLRLTPLLEAGNVTGARTLAEVPALLASGCCTSYSGFLTVDKEHDSNLLFWFFRAETRPKKAPLVVWLQGGPGTSMMRPVFLENGPYRLDGKSGRLERRQGTWTQRHNMLYFDNPVGTGYSFTGSPDGLSKTVGEISRSLIEALRQFFVMFPGQRTRDLYIAGESFGGKMATALAHAIYRLPEPADPSAAFNLKGVMVINGLVDVESQLDKSDIVYNLGLVDEAGRDEMKAAAAEQLRLVREGRWLEALKLSKDECGSVVSPQETGMAGLTNYLLWNGTQDDGFSDLAQHAFIRRALHVGNTPFTARASAVAAALRDDLAVSALPMLAELADSPVRVLVVSGQMDLCLPYRLTANFLRAMAWSGADQWASAPRVTWCVRGQLAGYAKTVRGLTGLTHVLVRNAGHYLGQDQPRWAANVAATFTDGASFDTCEERCALGTV
ncbi:venom serine carboxypeptidase-like [Thrips palmi]|uniref:Venom serine carboxypeptidase-like n=1 Tax=Thrips palmi TaxID=161013 RepID=A0A6P8ZJ89_THRPL|nr:venom serine carboxypeptidase-like [Thrips palmi]